MFNEQKLTEEFLEDATLTSEWIQKAIEFGKTHEDFDLNKLKVMDVKQIDYLIFFEKYFEDLESAILFVWNSGYNSTQFEVIISALNEGVDFNWITDNLNKDIPYAKMNWILAGIKDGYETFKDKKYLEYSADQLQEIYSAIKDEVEYSDYDNKNVSGKLMQVIRHARAIGLNCKLDNNSLIITE